MTKSILIVLGSHFQGHIDIINVKNTLYDQFPREFTNDIKELEINNDVYNNIFVVKVKDESILTTSINFSKLENEKKKDNLKDEHINNIPKSETKKRGRPRISRVSEKMLKKRRDAANARERKRMNEMTRAYHRLKERLPNNEKIVSKKKIVDQVEITLNRKSAFMLVCKGQDIGAEFKNCIT